MIKSFNPYPGLRPYRYEESHLFFGRERHIAEIIRKLEQHRFVSIVGNSGSGKSSIVKAGVLPSLVKQDENWITATFRPGENPIFHLANDLFDQNIFKDKNFTKEDKIKIYEILKKNKLGLVQAVRPFIPQGKKLLLLVDQFEELFRFNALQKNEENIELTSHFVGLLLAAIGQKEVPIYIMMTLRSDFLGDCEQFDGLPEAINDGQFLIPRMKSADLANSITGPMKMAEGNISPRLAQQLLSEIGNNPDQLPILQHALMRTWEVWAKKGETEQPLDLEDYKLTGGMKLALLEHAEEAYAELKTTEQKRIAEVLFKTITLKTSENRGIRRPSTIKSIANIAETKIENIIQIADVFRNTQRGFIMPSINETLGPDSILDISHESLMRVWERLKNWVNEEGESAELYERITSNALLFEQDKASLWRNPDLQIARDWKNKQQPNEFWAVQYNNHFNKSMRFIEASINEQDFAIKDAARKRKILIYSSISLFIALSALTAWAISERNNAEINANNAIKEKSKTEVQKNRAEQQTIIAQQNLVKAKDEEKRAQKLQIESEWQKNIAVKNAEQARVSKLKAESESIKAIAAQKQAEIERQIARNEKALSDSLRLKAEGSEKISHKLSMLSLSQNLAIKSKMADKNVYPIHIKALLALQAYKFNKEFGGKKSDPEILSALVSAYRFHQEPKDYINNIHTDEVKSLDFNDINNNLVSVGSDGIVLIITNAQESKVSSKSQLIYSNASYNAPGNKIALTCDDNSIHLYDANNIDAPTKTLSNLHPSNINSLIWYDDNIITASVDNKIRIIDMNTQKVIIQFELPTKPISMAYNKHGSRLIVGTEDGKIYTANLKKDDRLSELLNTNNGKINCVDINRDGSMMVYGTSSGICQIVEFKKPNNPISLAGHQAGISSVKFSPTHNNVATACYDKKVRLFTISESIVQPIIFSEHSNWILDIAFSSDGKQLASCGKDKLVITYPIDPSEMVDFLENKVGKNFTKLEWNTYINEDIAYEKTIPKLN
jgi:WD40 repeat protein/energy-coupling factor transporter ATP-binding protein EcfA2